MSKLLPKGASSSFNFSFSFPWVFLKLNTTSYRYFNFSLFSGSEIGSIISGFETGVTPFKFSIHASKILTNPKAPASTTLFSFKTSNFSLVSLRAISLFLYASSKTLIIFFSFFNLAVS